MNNQQTIKVDLTADIQRFQKGMRDSLDSVKKFESGSKARIAAVEASYKRLSVSTSNLLAGGAAVYYANQIRLIADEYTNLNSRLKLVTDSSGELKMVQDELYRISQETGTEYAANADSFSKLAFSLKDAGAESKEILQINELVNKSLIINGSSAAEASSFMLQFAQAMGSGVLQGDEFRAMMESNSFFAQSLAKALDTDIGGLRKMSKEGKLTSDVLRDAFPKMATEINSAFANIAPTTQRALIVLRNAFYKIIDDSNQAGKGTSRIADAILELSNTVEANREDIVSLFVGVVETIPSVISGIKGVAGAISSLAAVGNTLGLGGMEMGIIGALLWRGKAGAAGILSMFFILNNNLEKVGLNVQAMKPAAEGFAHSMKNVYDGLSGKRDFNTGEFTGGLEKMVADAKKSFGEIKRTSSDTFSEVSAAAEKSGSASGKPFQKVTKEIEQQYRTMADKVKGILDEIAGRENSLAAELRDMGRAGMTELQAWQDLKAEADEYYKAAQQAAAAGNFDLAKQKADEAKAKYKELNSAVQENGQEVVSQAEAQATAMDGVKLAGELAIESLNNMAKAQADAAKTLDDQTGGALAKNLPEIAKQFAAVGQQTKELGESAAEFDEAWNNSWDRALLGGKEAIAQLEKELKELTKDRHIKIYVEEIQKKAIGGPVVPHFARGGRLSGYGGGDRISALLEAGEFIIRKEAVSKFGSGFFAALNSLRLPIIPRFAAGGLAGASSSPSSSAGSPAYNITLNYSGSGSRTDAKAMADMVFAELQRRHRRAS